MKFFNRSVFLLAVTVLAALSSCSKKKDEKAAAPGGSAGARRPQGPISVDGYIVRQSSVSEQIEVPGSLLPYEETSIRAEVGGRIIELNINEGSHVAKGTLLVKLFDKDLQAQLKKLQVQLQINEKTEERNKELLKINAISQQDYDLSSLNVENLRADMESVRISISKTEIRAPYDGTAGLRNVSLGAFLSPSDIVTTIRQVEQLKLEFSIPEKYAKEISKGYGISFRVDGGLKTHNATVIATDNSVDQATRTLRVKAVVKEKDRELVPGVFAKVNLQLGKNATAVVVPSQAIIPTIRNKQIIILRKDSVLFSVVETGIRDSAYVQILKGVNVGDTVITTGLMAIRPNSKIKISKLKTL
jgi:membrane fusion protein (multidrug efflux system)